MTVRTAFLVLCIALTCLTTHHIQAQSSIDDIPNTFFREFVKDPAQAVDNVFSTNKWINRNLDAVQNLKTQLKGIVEVCGEYYGFEKIGEKSAGPRYKILIYMAKYERQPLRFVFLMYKAKDKWQVQNFSFDSDMDEDLKEAAKLYRLKENE